MQDIYAAIRDLGVDLVAISPQNMEHTKETASMLTLTYPVLADAANGVADQFGLKYQFPDYAQEAYTSIGADLADYNIAEPWTLPVPGLFIIKQDGTLHFTSVDSDYRNRIEPDMVLEQLKAL